VVWTVSPETDHFGDEALVRRDGLELNADGPVMPAPQLRRVNLIER
jgi:hypothetical protein